MKLPTSLFACCVGATVLLSACANQSFVLRGGDAERYKQDSHFFVAGVGQTETLDAAKICGGAANVARIENQETAKDILLTLVTLGIYSPREFRVYCVK